MYVIICHSYRDHRKTSRRGNKRVWYTNIDLPFCQHIISLSMCHEWSWRIHRITLGLSRKFVLLMKLSWQKYTRSYNYLYILLKLVYKYVIVEDCDVESLLMLHFVYASIMTNYSPVELSLAALLLLLFSLTWLLWTWQLASF